MRKAQKWRRHYQRLVEKLVYLSHTRPDIAYAVSVVSQFMHHPRERHLRAMNRIIQYFKASPVQQDRTKHVEIN